MNPEDFKRRVGLMEKDGVDPQVIKKYVQTYQNTSSVKKVESPGIFQSIVQGVAKPFLKVAATAAPVIRGISNQRDRNIEGFNLAKNGGGEIKTPELTQEQLQAPVDFGYLGKVSPIGGKAMTNLSKAQTAGDVVKGATRGTLDTVGTAAELASYGNFAGALKNVPANTALRTIGAGALSGAVGGAGASISNEAENDNSLATSALNTTIGTLAGTLFGGATAGVLHGVGNKLFGKTDEFVTKQIDKDMKSLFSEATGDAVKIHEDTQLAKNGLGITKEMLDSGEITVPNTRGSVGKVGEKVPSDKWNGKSIEGNNFVSVVKQAGDVIANKMKTAVAKAVGYGEKLDLPETAKSALINLRDMTKNKVDKSLIQKIIDSGDIQAAHDFVENANSTYVKDLTTSNTVKKTAQEVSSLLRGELDKKVYRGLYGDSYKSIVALKKAVLLAAKKSNKKLDIGDLADDVAIDAMFALQFSNPAFMVRSLVTKASDKIMGKYGKNSGMRALNNTLKKIEPASTKELDKVKLPQQEIIYPASKNIQMGEAKFKIPAGIKSEPKPKIQFDKAGDPATVLKQQSVKAKLGLPLAGGVAVVGAGAKSAGAEGYDKTVELSLKENPIVKAKDGTEYRKLGPTDTKAIDDAFTDFKKKFPDDGSVNKKIIKAIYQKESSSGTNQGNAEKNEGSKWMVGQDKVSKEQLLKDYKSPKHLEIIKELIPKPLTRKDAMYNAMLLWKLKGLISDGKGGYSTQNVKDTYTSYNGAKDKLKNAEDFMKLYNVMPD